MAARNDHDTRDAEDAIRKEVNLLLGKYARRMTDSAYTYAAEELAAAKREKREVDGTNIGRRAAVRAINEIAALEGGNRALGA